jgi:predicted phosphodiesterase
VKIAVISDLHLGSGDRTDLFGHDDHEFLRFLSFLEDNFEKIVLLGDVWETLTSARYGEPLAELDRARAFHREIAARFDRPAYAYVHGNHDIVAGRRGVPEELSICVDGVRVLFTHGHQNDFVIRRLRWMSEIGVWIGGWIRRFGLQSLYRLAARGIDGIHARLDGDATRGSFQRWAIAAARARAADVVVTGHTHVAARDEHGDRLFLNSGSCSNGKFSFVSLDTRAGSYRVSSRW